MYKIMTTGKNRKNSLCDNMNLVLESFESNSEARDLKLKNQNVLT